MTDITAADVEHLAQLARIDLAEGEIERVTGELIEIQHLIQKVQEVATPDVKVTTHPIAMHNVTRADEVGEPLDRDAALAGAPDSDGTRFRVTAILGEEQ
ncbi:Asp-tRNA(Asn)/Glu-tRNA(Gln) amidotransferase GatCAB subunit C [Pseudoclavibacter sp. RFBJ3]|uniref:Asp-tRNA(Asn)/Glu-tRNA(Gln) amidotransferase subunit GatC n=1 Tax=unclassified Pseudoclavibacter TaxID=2615177 RepID=UPI000CE8D63E|nr:MULTISPECIES: Asp-tRNA(Asn)/Glu-tRNA(Gln) amidotransferase subunit GatC [unclassified Pseudoclavibacter]MBF4460324.1 Asp-tRNA(Asn)/Glu-tRNA(Gln) amidotransferase subunit GatC [Pseudoclavibacter sp. VKM Ac-2867]PPF37512.1 Asp-tRNA(Asn)/Glu-tRNA(Gln) amidotransferase GatCAB subunit C [Pseudoclavibacter sp. AY1H1]PPF85460.1 Asp-tRNA(Asn)/Glu-tRNA(Gln) amidotransferase GatCAB subunit C [Pseudoclavibacter sp. RFBJ5]PPF93145.1 Asp-tRNA(Asn)/Glu-tRNA(Gln) amidotransferase GatCAB subunit C [Pseudocl